MENSHLAFLIGLMAGSIFFIDGWGPSTDPDFAKSKRFRGLAILIGGGIITPILDYVTTKKPEFFLAYLRGSIYGWFYVMLAGLILYLIWILTKDKEENSFLFKLGDFFYDILDFIYLGISDNPHINTKRANDIKLAERIYVLKNDEAYKRREKEIKNEDLSYGNIKESTKLLVAQQNLANKANKPEAEYNFDDWFYKGIAEIEKNEYEKCIAYMKNALDKDKHATYAADAYMNMGVSYERLGLYDKSIQQLKAIIMSYPTYDYLYMVYDNMAIDLLQLRRNDEALKAAEEAIKLKADYGSAWLSKGTALSRTGKNNESLLACQEALRLEPDNILALFNCAGAHALNGQKTEMLDKLKKAIMKDESYKILAKGESDFKAYWDDDDFKNLVA